MATMYWSTLPDQSDTDFESPENTEPPEQSDPGEQVATPEDAMANLIPTKTTTWMTTSTKTIVEINQSSDKTHLDLDVQVDQGAPRIGMVFVPTELNTKVSLLCYLC